MVVAGGLVGRGGGLIHKAPDKYKLIPGQMRLCQELNINVSKPLFISLSFNQSVFSSLSIKGALQKYSKSI